MCSVMCTLMTFFTYNKYFDHIHSLPFLFPNMPHSIFTSYMYICKYMWNAAYFISHLLTTLSQGYLCVWFLSSLYILDVQLASFPFCRLFAYSFVSTCERKHLSFCIWLILLNMIISNSIPFPENESILFFFMAK